MAMTRDEAIVFLKGWNARFNGDLFVEVPSDHDGILFWRVGQNASHEFYAGVGPDGRLYSMSCGPALPTDEEMPGDDATVEEFAEFWDSYYGGWETSIREVENFNGYYGHF